MKALKYDSYGSHENLYLDEIEKPTPGPKEVLIKIEATALNASDIEYLQGKPAYTRIPGLFKPSFPILGSDIAGIVEEIGKDVSYFKVGDPVLGDILMRWGGLAEYVTVPEELLMLKPHNLSFEEAAAFPQSGVIALKGIYEKGQVREGDKVLILGAGGGSGSFAIQLAKSLGAIVTAVDTEQKAEIMKSLGADVTINYKEEDICKGIEKYNLILDLVAHGDPLRYRSILTSKGQYYAVGGSIGSMFQTFIFGSLYSLVSSKKISFLPLIPKTRELFNVSELIQEGYMKAHIDKLYTLDTAKEAFAYMESGNAKGKVVVKVA